MKCGKVREYLSEYIDENLEATTKALVEEHLSACKDCQKEVASLRMLINDLGSMETVEPPKDFLGQLHKRMERRSWLSKTLDTLSIPMRAKLPMKLAGAVVMAVLAFTIFQVQKDQYGSKMAPLVRQPTLSESAPPKMAKAPLETGVLGEAENSGIVMERLKPMPQTVQAVAQKDGVKRLPDNAVKKTAHVEEEADLPSREVAPIELPLTKTALPMQEPIQTESSHPKTAKAPLGPRVQEEVNSSRAVTEKAKPMSQAVQVVAEKSEAKRLPEKGVKEVAHVGTKADHPSRKGAPIELSFVLERVQSTDTFEVASDMEAFQARETKMRRRLTMGEAVPTKQLERDKSIEHLLPRLWEVIERAGGEIVSAEYEGGSHIPESVLVEIPAKRIGIFQNDLQALGEFHGLPIGPTGEDEEVLPIRIRLLTP